MTRLGRWALLAALALGAAGCFDFDQAFEDCKTNGFCTDDGGTGGPVIITVTTLPDAYAGRAYTQTLTATGGTGTFAWSVSAGALPAGLSLSTDGALSGTATDPGSASFTVTAASGGRTADQPLTLEVLPALALTTAALADGYTGQAYSRSIAATGGKPPYVFAVQGTVPDGLSLSSSGVLSGTPIFAFSGTVTIAVRDANSQVTATPLPITIYAPPLITTGQLPDGYTNEPYSVTVAAVDGKAPYAFSISGGTLPPGLSLDPATGQISGNPSVPQNVTLIVTVTDANGKAANRPLTLGIYAPVSITSAATLPDAYTQTGYDVTLTRSGGKGTVIWIASSGLPAGISLSIDGHLTGSPSTANPTTPSTFSVTATDGGNRSDTKTFSLSTYDLPRITTAALADGTLSVSYADQLAATGGKAPLSWMLGSGSLPNGLTLSASGQVSGMPSTAGGSSFLITVSDANGRTWSSTVTCTVYSALTISTASLAAGFAGGVPYSANLAAAGGRSPYTWTLISGGLPSPLALSAGGTISGTPAAAGTSNFTVQVTDANSNTTTKALSLGIVPPPGITTTSLDDGYIGVAYAITVQAQDGKPPYAYSLLTGALPNGLSLDPVTGQISGTPSSAASANVTVQLTDGNGLTASRAYAFGTYATPSVTTTALPDGYVGDAFSQALASSGGKPPYTWSLAAGSFAAGLTLNGNGTVTGTPAAVQSTSVTVRISDANGRSASRIVTQEIYAPPAIVTSLADGYNGEAYPSTALSVNGGKPPYTFNVTAGSLPAGMSFAGATGTLSGTPSVIGPSSFTVTVTDANARSASLPMSLPVYDLPSVITAALPDAYAGTSYTQALAGAGGKLPITWSVSSGTLPSGLSLSGIGSFSGSSGTAGSSTFTVQRTDANGRQATRSLSLAVLSALSVTTAAVSDGYVGSSYSTTALAATGGRSPYTFSAVGALPSGVSLSGGGAFSGTPTASGTATFDARVTDANAATAQRTLTLAVYNPPTVGGTLADAYQGTSYSGALTGTNGKPPYSFAVTSGTLPAGLSLSAGGTITGTPTTAGNSTFTVTLTDANGVTANRNLTVSTLAPVAVATASLADAYQGLSYSMTLAGSGGRTPYTFAITAGTLPGGLSLTGGSGLISGTPAAVGSSNITVTVTDANGVAATRAFTLPVLAVPSITTTTLPDGYVSNAYSAPGLAGTNGRAPYTFSVASGLPPGVSVSSGGAFSGAPTGSAASYPFTATLTDANGITATANLTIAVWAALVVGGGGLPDGYLTTAYTGGLSASGGKTPYTWSVSGGALTSGVTLNASSGGLTGTPTATGTASFTAQVSDANGVTASGAKSIQTFALPSIPATTLANASQGAPYSASLAVSGGKPAYTWSVTAGAPPAGITLAADGTLSGTTNASPATFNFTATVTDANGKTDSRALSLQVVTGLNIITSAILDGYQGLAFSQTLSLTGAGGVVTWSVIAGTLTPGLTLGSSTGAITGTPTTAGTYNFTIQASDTISGTTSKAFTQTVYTQPSVATTSLPDAYTDQAYSQTLAASGGKAPYSWAITVGAPPAGITFNGGSSGSLSGQASGTGSSSFTVQVTDANGRTATRPLSITAYAPPAQTSPTALPDGYTGRSYNATIGTTGGKAPLAFTVTAGALPANLTLGSSTGTITGTPTSTLGTSTFTVTVTDANGRTAPLSHTITIYAPPAVTTSSLPQGWYQVPYGPVTLTATGGVAPLTWSVTAGALPSGLALTGGTGTISGSPTNAGGGNFDVTVTVTDVNGITANATLSITTAAQLAISTMALPDGYLGLAYNASLASAGGRPAYSYAISSGALPAGVTMSSGGVFSGTPTGTAGTASFVVTVSDANGTQATRALSIQVFPQCTITTASLPDGYTTLGYSSTLAGSGGKTPYTWTVTAGVLPGGVTLTGSTGQLSGTPGAPGTANPTFTLTDANGVTASAPLPIVVYTLPQISTPSPLADGYANQPFNATMAATGGKAPLSWTLSGGSLPPGLTLSGSGTIGSVIGSLINGQGFSFTVGVSDANGKNASKPFTMTGYQMPNVTTTTLTTATEGITYMRLPASFVTIVATNGKTPYSFSAIGLPGGLSVDGPTGRILGIPAQATAGAYPVQLRVNDANGQLGQTNVTLSVAAAKPIRTGGANATAPTGSPITDALTVFVIDSSGDPVSGAGVRVRKNGVEYAPAKDQLTNVTTGKAFFSGMGLISGSDTVDITASGPGITTTTLAGVNAALVTLSVNRLDAPPLRLGAAASYDANLRKLLVTMGSGGYRSASAFGDGACLTDVQRLESFSPTASWVRAVEPAMSSSPPGRTDAAFAYSPAAGLNANYLFGGASCSGMPLNDLWRYNSGSGWVPINTPTGPGPRQAAAMAADSSGRLVLFGGLLAGGAPSNELWRFDPQGGTWTNQSGTVPGFIFPRFGMGSTALNGDLWICGGFAGITNPSPVSDCYSVSTSGTWTTRPNLPSPRALLSMASDSATGRVYAFGGRTSGGETSELLYWSNSTNQWNPVPALGMPPEPRERAAAFFDTSNRLVVVGGNRQFDNFGMSDVDVYDPGTNTWTHVAGGFPPSTGFTVSGSIQSGVIMGRARPQTQLGGYIAYVWATSSSGWDGRATVNLVGGNGSYSISGIPPGDAITLNAFLVDPITGFPANLSSGVDLGVFGPINANISVDVMFPSMLPPQLGTIDVTVPGWAVYSLFGNPFQSTDGYPFLRSQNGLGRELDYRTVELGYYPPTFGAAQDATAGGASSTPNACEVSVHALANVFPPFPPADLTIPPRGLTPGLNECTPRGPGSQLVATTLYKPGSVAATPNSVASGLINNDSVPDLVVSNGSDGTMTVMFGRGDGTYYPANTLAASGIPVALTLANIAGDPFPSLVVATRGGTPSVQIFRGDGQGNLFFNQSFPVGQDPSSVTTADFNNDTYPDLVTANSTGQSVTIVFSRAGGGYTTPPTTITNFGCPNPRGVVAAKLDGDGLTDLAVACQGTTPTLDNRIQVLRGLAISPWVSSSPGPTLPGPGSSGPYALAAADVSGDAQIDVIAANTAGPAATLFKSNGDGGFQPYVDVGFGAANGAMGLAVADANADGKPDLLVGNTDAGQVLVYRNNDGGTGTFTLGQTLATARGPQGLVAADLNGDGRSDALVPCSTAGALEVLLQARPLSTVSEGAYQATIPAGMSAVQLIRGPELQWMDWQYFTPVSPGTTSVSITLPQTSTLAPPPVGSTPPGQVVGWTIQGFRSLSQPNLNTFSFGLLRPDDQTQAGASLYIRQ